MNETLFYVLGIALVVIALGVSFAGLRFENFPPSRPILVVGTLAITVLVGATMVFAWQNAEDEQAHHEAEQAHEEAEGDATEAEEDAGTEAEATSTTTTAASVDGAQVFDSAGCSGCHTLAAAGSSGTTGPDLDGALKGQSEESIRTSIVDPNAEVAEGFPPGVMPQDYETRLSPEDLDALVQYLVESTQ